MDDDSHDNPGPARQRTFYRGEGSPVPVAYEALVEAAEAAMSPAARAFVGARAGGGATRRNNRTAFDRWEIVPRVLRDVSDRDSSVELFGRTVPAPVALAPVGAQSVVHEEGEAASARAAASLGVPFALSTAASTTIEAVADEMGTAPRLFQLYWSAEDALARSFVERAERAGYDAILVTVDAPHRGWMERELERGAFPPADGHGLANYASDPVFREALAAPPDEDPEGAVERYLDVAADPSLSWEDLSALRDWTDLPVLVKGVLHPADAAEAAARADGVVVSNHGGRTVDRAVGALSALPRVADAVEDGVVLFDSGVRRGVDAFVALALGADAVLLGRPYVYGLGLAGETGVREVVANFLADLDLTLALSGHAGFDEVDRDALVRAERGVPGA